MFMNAWCIDVNNPSFLEYMAGSQNSDFPKIINGTVPPQIVDQGSIPFPGLIFISMKWNVLPLFYYDIAILLPGKSRFFMVI